MNSAVRSLFFALPVFTSLLLSGCVINPAAVAFNQTFEGYPCGSQCNQFKSGFEAARSGQFTQTADCQSLSPADRLGCLSYLHEYRIAHSDQI